MQTVQKVTYYKDKGCFHGVTAESPKNFPNIKIGRGPLDYNGVEGITERCYSDNELAQVTKVEAADVPDEWFEAIGYEERPAYKKQETTFKFKIKDADLTPSAQALFKRLAAGEKLPEGFGEPNPPVIDALFNKIQAEPRHDREPAEVEITDYEPSAIAQFVNNSLFPRLLAAGLIIFCLLFRGCI